MKQIIFLLLVSTFAKAQSIKGTLISSDTKEPIPYATIKIESLKKSVTSKQNGSFLFNEKIDKDVILDVEAFGFENTKIKSSELSKNSIIELKEAVELLPDLIIPNPKAKISHKIYGRTNEGSGFMQMQGSIQSYHKDDFDKGSEFGIIVSNKGLSELESFHIHLSDNQSKKLVYRLQFYEVENGKPSKKINHDNILLSITDKNKGWQVLDLSDKNIFIDASIPRFAITLKLVDANFDTEYSYLQFNTGAAINNQLIVKFSEFEKWNKIPMSIPMYVKAKVYK